jgi:hypothetical protein
MSKLQLKRYYRIGSWTLFSKAIYCIIYANMRVSLVQIIVTYANVRVNYSKKV